MHKCLGHLLRVFVTLLSFVVSILISAPSASAAGTGYGGSIGGTSVGLSTLKVYRVVPLTLSGGAYAVSLPRAVLSCAVAKDTYGKPYVLVIAQSSKEVTPLKRTTVINSFFAGVFLGTKEVVKAFPHAISCTLISTRIKPHDLAYLSVGRHWVLDKSSSVKKATATISVATSGFFELVAPPKQVRGVKVIFKANRGSGVMAPEPVTVPAALDANTFVRKGYAFAGWNTKANGTGTSFANDAPISTSVSVTLYAQWTKSVKSSQRRTLK